MSEKASEKNVKEEAVKKATGKAAKKVDKTVEKKIEIKTKRKSAPKEPHPKAKFDVPCMLASGLGALLGGTSRAANWFSGAMKPKAGLTKLLSRREKIRSVVRQELANLLGAGKEVPVSELEKRVRVMAEAIQALQQTVSELTTHGPVSDADMRKAVDSLKVSKSLSEGERSILVSVFRQNKVIQKPDTAGDVVQG